MNLNEEEKRFLAKRKKLVHAWPVVGAILLASVIGLGVWLFWTKPLLSNPFVVVSQLNSGLISSSTMTLMAGLLPIAVVMCLVLVGVIVVFVFAAISNEKRLLAMIQKMSEPACSEKQPESDRTVSAQSAPVDEDALRH